MLFQLEDVVPKNIAASWDESLSSQNAGSLSTVR